jgi:hypothetical protein
MLLCNRRTWNIFIGMKQTREIKQARSDKRRTEFVTARITGPARHYLEVLARLHDESLSSVIQRAIVQMATARAEHGGAWINADDDKSSRQLARDTWAEEEWLRRLKLFLIYPEWTPLRERQFWGKTCATKRYWAGHDWKRLSLEDKKRFVGEILEGPGIPREDLIVGAWDAFKESMVPSAA